MVVSSHELAVSHVLRVVRERTQQQRRTPLVPAPQIGGDGMQFGSRASPYSRHVVVSGNSDRATAEENADYDIPGRLAAPVIMRKPERGDIGKCDSQKGRNGGQSPKRGPGKKPRVCLLGPQQPPCHSDPQHGSKGQAAQEQGGGQVFGKPS